MVQLQTHSPLRTGSTFDTFWPVEWWTEHDWCQSQWEQFTCRRTQRSRPFKWQNLDGILTLTPTKMYSVQYSAAEWEGNVPTSASWKGGLNMNDVNVPAWYYKYEYGTICNFTIVRLNLNDINQHFEIQFHPSVITEGKMKWNHLRSRFHE